MATAVCPEMKSREDFVDEFLTCSICAEPYDSGSHQAKCLPCLHTFCKSCLEGVAGKRVQFECPNCRKLIKLPSGETVDSLPNNFIVENLREYQNIFNLGVLCGNCNKGNAAVRFCYNCGLFQCQRCTDNHEEMRSMQLHQLVTFEELQAKKCNPLMQQQQNCKKHPNSDLTLYCRDGTCQIPVCASCGLVDHKTHDLVHLDAAINEIVTAMRQSSERVDDRHKELTEIRTNIKAVQKTIADNFVEKQKHLQESEQLLLDQIRAQYINSQSLKNLYDSEMERLNESIEQVDFLIAQMSSACQFAKQSCDMSQPMYTHFLSSKSQIMERLNELKRLKLPKTSFDNTKFALTAGHVLAVSEIQKQLQHVGGIVWEGVKPLKAGERKPEKQKYQRRRRHRQESPCKTNLSDDSD